MRLAESPVDADAGRAIGDEGVADEVQSPTQRFDLGDRRRAPAVNRQSGLEDQVTLLVRGGREAERRLREPLVLGVGSDVATQQETDWRSRWSPSVAGSNPPAATMEIDARSPTDRASSVPAAMMGRVPRKLAPGWSWPVRASEVDEVVPGFTYLTWSPPWGPGRRSQPTDEGWLLAAYWRAEPGRMPPFRLTIYAVPSALRQQLRRQVAETVGPAVSAWRADADGGDGWRMLDHYEGWFWTSDGTVRRDPTSG